jgi:GNAT superfamily N-acetyltransferase
MIIKELGRSGLSRLSEIDRSEEVSLFYRLRNGRLEPENVAWKIPRWSEDDLKKRVEWLGEELDAGGVMLGAIDGGDIAGFALLGGRFIGENTDTLQLIQLQVTRECRGKGAGTRLLDRAVFLAKEKGAKKICLSAAPTKSAIGFYERNGFSPRADNTPGMRALFEHDLCLEKAL